MNSVRLPKRIGAATHAAQPQEPAMRLSSRSARLNVVVVVVVVLLVVVVPESGSCCTVVGVHVETLLGG